LAPGSIIGIVRDVIIVAVAVAVIWIGLQVYFGASNPFYVVSSGSMYPELKMYDIIVITGNQPFEDVKVGDIIVFDRPRDHNKVIVHRVVAVVDDDPKTLRTKGDNNQSSIPGTDFPITEKEYTGTVVHVVPQVGYITKILLKNKTWFCLSFLLFIAHFMARITVEDCLKKIDNQYDLVLLAKERTSQLNAGNPPLVPRDNDKNTVIALREIGDGKVSIKSLQESAINKLRKYQKETVGLEEMDDEHEDNFDKIYKGEISKSGTAILPSKRAKRIPEKINSD